MSAKSFTKEEALKQLVPFKWITAYPNEKLLIFNPLGAMLLFKKTNTRN